jgi:glycosyltransferase involved in cell wall biosynthesis
LQIAKELRLEVFVHARNYGYGGNQKTCYTEALKAGADIVVMLHPDYQYDPMLLPNVVAPIKAGAADVVLGSRLLAGDVIRQGMPWWKFLGNRFLTGIQNWVLGRKLTEYHTGYRAFSRRVLEAVPFLLNPTILFSIKKCSSRQFTSDSESKRFLCPLDILPKRQARASKPAWFMV